MPELNPKHLEAVMAMINQGFYFKHLSMFVKQMGLGYSVVEVEISDKHLNPFGALHGGVYASAIDTAAYWAVYCDLDEDAEYTTMDVKVDYLAPLSGSWPAVSIEDGQLRRALALERCSDALADAVRQLPHVLGQPDLRVGPVEAIEQVLGRRGHVGDAPREHVLVVLVEQVRQHTPLPVVLEGALGHSTHELSHSAASLRRWPSHRRVSRLRNRQLQDEL